MYKVDEMGMTLQVREVHWLKASKPIETTEVGMVIEVREMHEKNE